MSGKFSMDDYVDVAERITMFAEKYPEGTLQTIDWTVETVGEQMFIVYRAAAYRTPTDKRPGHGTAWEPFPGKTPYTRDSELMNAETSAWGRAIVACGLSSRKIASKQEVKARQGNGQPQTELVSKADAEEIKAAASGLTIAKMRLVFGKHGLDADAPLGQVPKAKAAELVADLAGVER